MDIKTQDEAWEAVREDGLALENVPKEFLTVELCSAAIEQNPYALQFVPFGGLGAEDCAAAVKRCGSEAFGDEFGPEDAQKIWEHFVPQNLKNETLMLLEESGDAELVQDSEGPRP